jgi:serine protease inhibitor
MTTRTTLTLSVALLTAACDPATGPVRQIDQLPRALTAAEREVIRSSNDFAFELLGQVNADQPSENLFISPLSVSMALGMAMNGAAGSTFEEMRTTLGFTGLTQDEINDSYRTLTALLLALDPAVEIGVGNSIWYRRGLNFEQDFFDRVRTSFGAEVRGLDFTDPASVKPVNDWVRQQTRGRIREILDGINPLDVMYLINAIYFKGDWTRQFDKAATRPDRFTGLGGTPIDVRMMQTEGRFRAAWTPELEAVDLPYGGGAFSMTIVVPRDSRDVNDLVARFGGADWDRVVDALAEQETMIFLPRFRLEYEKELNEVLKALGIRSAFAPGGADFTRMSAGQGREIYVSGVRHKTFVDVHEEGTEAAAVTKVTIRAVSAPPMIRLDRPFLFAIRERHSGTILFMGKIVSPREG